MRKVLILFKKDITLAKSNIFIVILISLGIPIYLSYAFKEMGLNIGAEFLSLFLSSFYCFFVSFGKLGIIEHKYRGAAYLTLTPITRKDIVISKYVFSTFIFLTSVIGYEIIYLILPSVQPLTSSSILIVWAIDILVLSIYIPLEFKVGYENVKYYLTAIVVFSPFLIGLLGKYNGLGFFTTLLQGGSKFLPFIFAFSLLLIIVSYYISVSIYEKKDL